MSNIDGTLGDDTLSNGTLTIAAGQTSGVIKIADSLRIILQA